MLTSRSCTFLGLRDYNPAMTETDTTPAPTAADPTFRPRRRASGLSWSVTLAIVFLLLAALLGAALWFQQSRFESAGRDVAAQVQAMSVQLAESRRESRQAIALVESHAGRIAELELALRDAQSQFAALDQAWQSFNKGMEDSMLASDLDRLVTLAGQQMRLSGTVNNAVMALETALSTLARAERPRFAGVQRAINADLERLRAVPIVDVQGISSHLDVLLGLISRAPLLVPDAAAPRSARQLNPEAVQSAGPKPASTPTTDVAMPATSPQAAGQAADTPWWGRALGDVSAWSKSVAALIARELSAVIHVQRVGDASALLLSPEQSAQLRANLRSRLLTAQLALVMRQSALWKAELAAVESTIGSRYDPQSPDTIAALKLARELAATPVVVPLPDLSESMAALESVRSSEAASAKAGE